MILRSLFTAALFTLLCTCVRAQVMNMELVYPDFDRYENFLDLYVALNGNGFAVGKCGLFLRTSNDGRTWTVLPFPANINSLSSVQCQPGTGCEKGKVYVGRVVKK